MTWMKNFFGDKDKAITKRSEEVDTYVEQQKKEYMKSMREIARQARVVREDTRKAHEATKNLVHVVDDVVNKIAIVTGNPRGKRG